MKNYTYKYSAYGTLRNEKKEKREENKNKKRVPYRTLLANI